MARDGEVFDVAIVGGGLAGVLALAYARRAGLEAVVLERQERVGGLWRDLPAWQDIQISPADWALGDMPMEGVRQPHILANILSWVERFDLADGIRLNAPVQLARTSGDGWDLVTPQGIVHALHLIAATGAHNLPIVPPTARLNSAVREFHSSALHAPAVLTDRDVLVVGGRRLGFRPAGTVLRAPCAACRLGLPGLALVHSDAQAQSHRGKLARVRADPGERRNSGTAKRRPLRRPARPLRAVRTQRDHALT